MLKKGSLYSYLVLEGQHSFIHDHGSSFGSFNCPGALHKACWMSKLLYTIKIDLMSKLLYTIKIDLMRKNIVQELSKGAVLGAV